MCLLTAHSEQRFKSAKAVAVSHQVTVNTEIKSKLSDDIWSERMSRCIEVNVISVLFRWPNLISLLNGAIHTLKTLALLTSPLSAFTSFAGVSAAPPHINIKVLHTEKGDFDFQ